MENSRETVLADLTNIIELQQAICVCEQSSWHQPNVASNTDNIAFHQKFCSVLRFCELFVSGRLDIK